MSGIPAARPGRALAPDLARGMMLLLIVLANIPWFLWGREHGVSVAHPIGADGLDRIVQGATIVAVDMRALPLFALLFGYGMVQFDRSRTARGASTRDVARMLARRHAALLVFGLAHAALLFFGDVLGAYGLLGLTLVPLLMRRSDRTIRTVRGVLVGLLILVAAVMMAGGHLLWLYPEEAGQVIIPAPENVNGIASWAGSVVPRLSEWAFITGYYVLALTVPIALLTGLLWAREGLLDRPRDHLPRLRRTAAIGLPVAWLGGLPMMLTHVGVLYSPDLSWAFMGLHLLTGLAGGLGYAAVFGLLAARRQDAPGPAVGAVAAVGRRSLTAYLFQSLCLAPLLAAWGLGLGEHLGSAAAAGIAAAIWATSVAGCAALQRAGRAGPAEALLRRLTYGRRAA